jgi:hypothetical protein
MLPNYAGKESRFSNRKGAAAIHMPQALDFSEFSDFIDRFLRGLSDRSTCEWCKHPVKLIYRIGLCRHCYSIRGKIIRLSKKIEECSETGREVPSELPFSYRAYLAMERSAKSEGRVYGRLYADEITGDRLAHEFSFISESLVHQDLYRGDATLFNWSFTPSQKRLLLYLLSLLRRAHLRRTRWKQALTSALDRDE